MPSPRFLVDAEPVVGEALPLPQAVVHHALRVLRLRSGSPITLFTGRGGEYSARLRVDGERAWAETERFEVIERESPLAVTLVQAWVATDKLDWIVEKAVELGVMAVCFVPAARSVVRLEDSRREKRLHRLGEIAVAACCQSGRNRVPRIEAAETLRRGLERALHDGAAGLLLDPESPHGLSGAAPSLGPLALAVGPEGGFDDDERSLAVRLGYRAVSLGPRTLRTETAGVAALAALQALAGDLR
jgi:16S rRNA (uracil1498-N3)-methyltransferase